jgi:hypothetical protein
MEYVTTCPDCGLKRHTDSKNYAYQKCQYCKGNKEKGNMKLLATISTGIMKTEEIEDKPEKIERVRIERVRISI